MVDHPDKLPSPVPTEAEESHPSNTSSSLNPKSLQSGSDDWMASGNEDITIDYDEAGGNADEESIFGDSSAMSLASSINHYRLENNRRYHTYRDGAYWAPHDEEALKLDNYAHLLFLLTLNDRLFLAPLDDPKNVLDIGTGIGIWAQNFADRYPDADVIGTDLSNVQKNYPAPNLRFEVDDCCSEWTYPENHFDYIHVRLLYGSIADWPAFYKECLDHLKPGGYLEHSEINPVTKSDDGTKVEGDTFDEAGKLAMACGEKSGKPLDIQPHIKDMIVEAGFTDVVEHSFKWPIGDWPADSRLKEIGAINARHWIEGIEAWTMRLLTRLLNWTPERVTKWCHNMKQAILSRKHHVYQPVSVVYARKPVQGL